MHRVALLNFPATLANYPLVILDLYQWKPEMTALISEVVILLQLSPPFPLKDNKTI